MIEQILDFWYFHLFRPTRFVGITFLFFMLSHFFNLYIYKLIVKMTDKTKTTLDTKIVTAFRKPVKNFIFFLGLFFALRDLSLSKEYYDVVVKLFRSTVIILITSGFYNLSSTSSALFTKLNEKLDFDIDRILIPIISKAIRFILVAISASIIAQEWGYDVNGFVAGLGIGGLAFALAAQDSLSNFFGGIVIILDKPFSIGDWILTPNVEGTVEDINFRSTKVRTFAHALVTVPNATLAKNPITNWSKMGRRRISFNLGVTYTTPREKLATCVTRIDSMLKNHSDIHPETIFVNFDSFNSSSLDIFIYCFTNTTVWGEFLKVKEDVNFKIMDILEQEGVSVAFPSRSLYFENPIPTAKVNIE
ncbi:mechanosensitive ion channel family protein [Alkalicella caledoniensis]|uniref:Mechanosensitive ion channel family protein n=1 Tax=Alkalicella caledoniensis TaxID=2731377 RepID=A0A7G9WBI3_ALKCA|nr:mechanosensitive ion channel family protein [Alkalicella caledoniensis]QNO16045.1 mechanosensitive ion channel family protein [Alkalicella caledoniensis]